MSLTRFTAGLGRRGGIDFLDGKSQTKKLKGGLMRDRSGYPVRRVLLEEEGREPDVLNRTPAERVAMVWQLTLQAWLFKEGLPHEPRLRRDVVRTLRSEN